jgi:aspartate racemase
MTRVVGLIGGMSWRTTAVYYKEINQYVCSKMGGVHSANLLIRSIDYADIARMVTTKDYDGMTKMLCQAGQELRDGGAKGLVLCANVAHKAADMLEKSAGLPVLHIADATGKRIVSGGYKKVGLLATNAVMEEEFYKSRLTGKFGLEVAVPSEDFRNKVDSLIFDELSKDAIPEDVKLCFHQAYTELRLEHNVDAIVLACTELRLVFTEEDFTVPTFDTTALHAQGVADWALSDS